MNAVQRRMLSASLIIGLFVLWEVVCDGFHVSDLVLPPPSEIFATLWERYPAIWPHALQTLCTTLLGFFFGVVAGVLLGVLLGVSKLAYDVANPLLVGFASIPKVALVPILALWFGSGTVPAVITAMITCLFPIVVNVATGLATTEPELEDFMHTLGSSKLDTLLNVGLPRTMPYFFASLKVAVTLAFVGAVISETVASNLGFGRKTDLLIERKRAGNSRAACQPGSAGPSLATPCKPTTNAKPKDLIPPCDRFLAGRCRRS